MSLAARFKTPAAATRFLAAYDAVLALWDVPHEALEVNGSFGITHINMAGAPDLPPLVLLHGAQMSSTVWYANIAALSRHFRVYALDVVDQIGRSVPTRKLITPQDGVEWLTGVLDALHLEQVVLVGHSQGGGLAFHMALRQPQRITRLVLLAPAPVFLRLRWQFFVRLLPMFIIPTRRMFYRGLQRLTTMPVGDSHPLIEQMIAGVRAFKPQELSLGVTSVFTDDELRQITHPTLLLIGDQEVIYDPRAALARAQRFMPHMETEIIAGGGHLFPVDQAAATNARLLKFLQH